jgi:hypothetical protein
MFAALSDQTKEDVMSLHDNNEGDKSVDGVLATNSLPSTMLDTFALCLDASRFNHSCLPNCDFCWDDRVKEIRIYAAANIEAGTELCISYTDVRDAERERRGNLRRRHGFECMCPVCQHEISVEGSDRRRLRMKAIVLEVENSKMKQPKDGVKLVNELLKLYNEEGIALKSYGKKACYYGYQLALLDGDLEQARWWIGRAYAYSVYCHGEDHEQTERLQEYLKEPTSHPANKAALRRALQTYIIVFVCALIVVKLVYDFYQHFRTLPSYPDIGEAAAHHLADDLPGQ